MMVPGLVTTVAGDPSVAGDIVDDNYGSEDGEGTAASFRGPLDVAAAHRSDGADAIYVADTDNHLIRQVVVRPGQLGTSAPAVP